MILLITVVFYITNIFLFIDLTIWGTYFFDRFFIIWFSLGYNLFLIRFYVSIGEKDDMMIENYWTNLTLFREINLITLYFFLSLLINIYSNQLSEYILAGLLGFIGFYFSFISTNKEIEKANKDEFVDSINVI